MYDDAHIANARELIQQCIELVQLEDQRDFLMMRLQTDLEAALAALEAVQTVVMAPLAVLKPAPHYYNLSELDDGEPSKYEVKNERDGDAGEDGVGAC